MVWRGKPTGNRSSCIAVAAVTFALIMLAGCGVVSGSRASGSVPSAISAGNQQASAACARTDPGSGFAIAVFAKGAASGLNQAHVTPNPWAQMSPDTVIFACFVTSTGRLTQGVYVDASGVTTPVPAGTYSGCIPPNPAATGAGSAPVAAPCSFRVGGSPSRSINPAIVAVLGVIAIAAVWFVTRRRKRQAAI